MCMWVHATRLLGTTAAAQEHEWFEGFDWNALQVCWEESPNETKAKHAMREVAVAIFSHFYAACGSSTRLYRL